MNKLQLRYQGLAIALLAGSFLGTPISSALAAEADDYADCRSIEDAAARLACYDRLASPEPAPDASPAIREAEPEPAPVKPAPPPPAQRPAAASTPAASSSASGASADSGKEVPLTDEVGRENLKEGQQEDRALAARGRLERCEKLRSGKYVFYFDNGQVWKQSDSKRMNWRNCTFEVTIGKDFFGYQMFRDGDDRGVRISRVR